MFAKKVTLLGFLAMLWLSGCAVRRYQAVPMVPADTASKLETRSLASPGLRVFLETNLGHVLPNWPLQTWDLGTLSLAAVYFHPALDVFRARVEEAQAAIVTAGARPNPTLSLAPGIPSPYLFSLRFDVPRETAGKRGRRVQVARRLDEGAQFDLADSIWKIRSGVRTALLTYFIASRHLELLRSEEQVRGEQVKLLEQRFSVGEIPRPDLDLAGIDLSKTHLAISTAEGQVADAKASLAASIGIPLAGLERFDCSWAGLESPPSTVARSPMETQRDAVLNRLDVRRALAQYAAAEAALQLETAKQYPDLQIGPGYAYEEKNSFFVLGLSSTLPVFNRNRGPIAEAEARRREAAAIFLEKQAQVIAESERALALYSAALQELREADQSLRRLQDTQEQAMEKAVRVGEEDPLTLTGVRLQTSLVALARLDALKRAETALGQLEDAVQRPLAPGDAFPANLESPNLNKVPRESER